MPSFPVANDQQHRRAASDLKESNIMLKTMPALSLGFLLAGAAVSNAGQPSRTPMHKLHAHRAAHYRTVGRRAREDALMIGSELKTGVPLGATSLVPETETETDDADSRAGAYGA